MLIQTVATVSFLPQVAVMIRSIRAHSKSVKFSVLVSDVTPINLQQVRERFDPDIEFLCCDDLGVDFVTKMRAYYNMLEFNSACKLLAVSYQLIKRKQAQCLFLDPDMYAVADISDVFKSCRRDILLTPHSTSPYPEDNALPIDVEIVLSGQINGGVVYFRKSPASMAALEWLIKRVKCSWFVAPQYGLYADQQWLSLLPYYFNDTTTVSMSPALNISYFNLHERNLSEDGPVIMANGQPALLFHFSGFSTPSNGKLTRHRNRKFSPQTEAVLEKIIAKYETLLFEEGQRFKGLKSDILFCQDLLFKRMLRAERLWGVKHSRPYQSYSFLEGIDRKIKRNLYYLTEKGKNGK